MKTRRPIRRVHGFASWWGVGMISKNVTGCFVRVSSVSGQRRRRWPGLGRTVPRRGRRQRVLSVIRMLPLAARYTRMSWAFNALDAHEAFRWLVLSGPVVDRPAPLAAAWRRQASRGLGMLAGCTGSLGARAKVSGADHRHGGSRPRGSAESRIGGVTWSRWPITDDSRLLRGPSTVRVGGGMGCWVIGGCWGCREQNGRQPLAARRQEERWSMRHMGVGTE